MLFLAALNDLALFATMKIQYKREMVHRSQVSERVSLKLKRSEKRGIRMNLKISGTRKKVNNISREFYSAIKSK